ncbi:piggyBac transposable element-derived protein 3-like [Colletes gigas]|uniref:piggyBac transposable element-derived protein 3-like n=1 Tax=Colletes gigas TaxID=935657 RepID=UPI001C9B9780|nr:piggyBac transposable element-derived protein 3-like [Colletes gigas]
MAECGDVNIILSFKMNKKLNKSNLENEKYVDKLLELLENGDDSDIDDRRNPNGLAHNFIPYQGSTTEINRDNVKKYGQSSAIVLELLEITKKEGHTVYFDNYFNSNALLLRLLELKMYAAGTVRMNRFYKPHFISDKDIKKKKRGYSEDLVSQDGIIMVKWLDNKPVHMASNFVGTGTIDKAKRWDKQKSAYIEIDRPEVVRQYNSNMGGVDLLDIWIEYKQDCIEAKIHKKDIMDLLELRMHVSKSLIYKNKLKYHKTYSKETDHDALQRKIA